MEQRISLRRMLCVFLSISLVLVSTAEAKGRKPRYPDLSEVMKRAAYDFPSVLAKRKTLTSATHDRRAAILNSISVTGSHTNGQTNAELHLKGVSSSTLTGLTATSLGVRLTLSFTTYYQVRSMLIGEELQKSALLALQMELAAQAAQEYMNFQYSDLRLYYLRVFLQSFKKIQAEVDSGTLTLNPVNLGLLATFINTFEGLIDATTLQKTSAEADMVKFLGYKPAGFAEVLAWLSENAVNKPPVANAAPTPTPEPKPGETKIDWEKVDRQFAVPATSELAYRRAQNGPALVQAGLGEKLARNSWYLRMSSALPFLTLAIDRTHTDTMVTPPGLNPQQASMGGTVTVGFQLGGGLISHLSSAGLLEEAARLNRRAAELQIKATLTKLYAVLDYKHSAIRRNLIAINKIQIALHNANPRSDQRFVEWAQLVQQFDLTIAQILGDLQGLTSTKIQVHTMMGTLLPQIDRYAAQFETKERKP